MRKKLQVFISSTYIDLIDERQAAVEAILNAGHIPAGMELFKAGNEPQWETIKRWIDDSDVFLLILGGRYGSLESTSGKSYTHLEYEYAIEKGLPLFAIVLNDDSLEDKVRQAGTRMMERESPQEYNLFKEQVLKKMCKIVRDSKDIKYATLETLNEFQQLYEFKGWISGKDVPNSEVLIEETTRLISENRTLKKTIEKLKSDNKRNVDSTTKETINFNIRVRTQRILQLLHAEYQIDYYELCWTNTVNGKEENVEIPHPIGEFKPYFVMDGTTIKRLLIIAIQDTLRSDFQSALADIRVMLSKYNEVEDMPIQFCLVIRDHQPDKIIEAEDFLNKALKKSKMKKRSNFSIEVWDEGKLVEIEKQLALRV